MSNLIAVDINLIGVVLGAVSNMVIGAIWYSPMVFGKTWMKLTGITQTEIDSGKKQMPKIYSMAFIGALITAYILALIIDLVGASTVGEGLQIGFLVWLGFIATTTLSSVLFEKKKTDLYVLNNGYNLISILVMSVIIILVP